MAFKFQPSQSIEKNVRRIARQQIDKAMGEINDTDLDRNGVVHQGRTRCKRLRALIRLVRPALGRVYALENSCIRDAAGILSSARDAQVMLETHDSLMKHSKPALGSSAYAFVREELQSRHDDASTGNRELKLQDFRSRLQAMRARLHTWKLDAKGYAAIEGGLRRTRQQAQKCLTRTFKKRDAESFHQLRKHAKYHWYHVRLLRPLWPEVFTTYAVQIEQLTQWLGDSHDLHVLRETVHQFPESIGHASDLRLYVKLLNTRSERLEEQSLLLSQRILAESSDAFAARTRLYWDLLR
jgi:CHAD domain-containing protein